MSAARGEDGGIRSVLLIDDEADIRRIAQLSLGNVGKLRVALAASGGEGIEVAARELPDVILLDVMMPAMDGPATLARLRATDGLATTPVIFLTAKVQRAEVDRLLALGATGVIAKPFDPMTLHTEVRRIVAAAPPPERRP